MTTSLLPGRKVRGAHLPRGFSRLAGPRHVTVAWPFPSDSRRHGPVGAWDPARSPPPARTRPDRLAELRRGRVRHALTDPLRGGYGSTDPEKSPYRHPRGSDPESRDHPLRGPQRPLYGPRRVPGAEGRAKSRSSNLRDVLTQPPPRDPRGLRRRVGGVPRRRGGGDPRPARRQDVSRSRPGLRSAARGRDGRGPRGAPGIRRAGDGAARRAGRRRGPRRGDHGPSGLGGTSATSSPRRLRSPARPRWIR